MEIPHLVHHRPDVFRGFHVGREPIQCGRESVTTATGHLELDQIFVRLEHVNGHGKKMLAQRGYGFYRANLFTVDDNGDLHVRCLLDAQRKPCRKRRDCGSLGARIIEAEAAMRSQQ